MFKKLALNFVKLLELAEILSLKSYLCEVYKYIYIHIFFDICDIHLLRI